MTNVKKGYEFVKKFDTPAADVLRALEIRKAKERATQKGAETPQKTDSTNPQVDTF